jgi:hypothetical protein
LSTEEQNENPSRIPRGAIATVIVGLVVTLMVIAIDLRSSGGGSDSTEWLTVEPIEAPVPAKLGKGGSFGLARTTLSAIAPVESGELLFRVSGVVEIDSGKSDGPATARCDVTSPAQDSFIARTPKRRASWPRPSEELQAQAVPEELVVKFKRRGSSVLGLPVRDSFRTFTDSAAPTDADWDGFAKQTQNWVWTMPEGTGDGGATLGYVVVFKTTEKPRAVIVCSGSSGGDRQNVRLEAVQQEWPILDPAEDTNDAGTEETADAETPAE